MKIISLWSGPRNVSTALMYSFAERPDTEVIDEPLYAHYLLETGADHPGIEDTLREMENNGDKAIGQLLAHKSEKPILFLKNMAHHFVSLDDYFLKDFTNIFLIRDPREMLPSLAKQIPTPILRDTGLDKQVTLYKHLASLGQRPAIIESKYLLQNPEEVLKKACKHIDIPFYRNMLKWEAGPRKEDGSWAKYWYHSVHKSTGFRPYEKKTEPFPEKLDPLLNECQPYYEFLHQKALKL